MLDALCEAAGLHHAENLALFSATEDAVKEALGDGMFLAWESEGRRTQHEVVALFDKAILRAEAVWRTANTNVCTGRA